MFKEYPATAATTPLLELDVTNWETPFTVAPETPPAPVECSGTNEALARCAGVRGHCRVT